MSPDCFSATTKTNGKKQSGNVRLMIHCILKGHCDVQHLECVIFTDLLVKWICRLLNHVIMYVKLSSKYQPL